MLNQIILVGRIANDNIEIKNLENNKKVAYITLAIPRSYKNADGEYETDFIDCELWNSVAESTFDYCKKGDIVGVKGRVECNRENNENKIRVVCEKLTFLSSHNGN